MKVFLDTEFLEGEQDKRFLGFKYGKTKPAIDLISIGLVSEDGREYYAISKDFNLHEAWNRYDLVDYEYSQKKVYWIRENVLKPIFEEHVDRVDFPFNYKNMKTVIEVIGKTKEQIAQEVKLFIARSNIQGDLNTSEIKDEFNNGNESVLFEGTEVYTYFGDYDWVVFCWLFGKMIDLPKGLPMYSKDLKQVLDEKQEFRDKLKNVIDENPILTKHEMSGLIKPLNIKEHPDYPKQESEHNALGDARWNKKLYEFLKTI